MCLLSCILIYFFLQVPHCYKNELNPKKYLLKYFFLNITEIVGGYNARDNAVMLSEFKQQIGYFKGGWFFFSFSFFSWLPAIKQVIIIWSKKCFTGKNIAVSKITPKSTIYRLIERFSCCEESFRVLKKVQQVSGPCPKGYSAAGSGHHHCRACSGVVAGKCECIWMCCEMKPFGGWPVVKNDKDATCLQDKHQRQADVQDSGLTHNFA